MIKRLSPVAQEPLYELITQVLRRNILEGHLPQGLVLLEGPISKLMKTSRVPVQAALRQLNEESLIQRFRGRGYLVGSDGDALVPLRRNIEEFALDIPEPLDTALKVRGTWMHVYDRVESEVAACQIFGEFRVVETELAEYLGVSRTVARDVLSRLNERGLVRKGAQSPWLAGPLTARIIREKFQLRGIVEPAALKLAADHIDPYQIELIRKDIASGETLHWETLEGALMQHCLEKAPNGVLVEIIRNNRLLLSSVDRALNALGLPPDTVALTQYRTLFDLIGSRQTDAAAEYLKEHLRIIALKSLARLKIVALVPETETTPPYLSRVG